jgi:hypothetical protein
VCCLSSLYEQVFDLRECRKPETMGLGAVGAAFPRRRDRGANTIPSCFRGCLMLPHYARVSDKRIRDSVVTGHGRLWPVVADHDMIDDYE